MSWEYARIFQVHDCWICTHIPHDVHEGVPMASVPWRDEEHNNCMKNKTSPSYLGFQINTPVKGQALDKPSLHPADTIKLIREELGHICFASMGDAEDSDDVFVGESHCEFGYLESPWKFKDQGFETFIYQNYARNGMIMEAPGAYFVCGKEAHKMLPYHWKGVCYIGYLIPAVTYSKEYPVAPRQRRSLRGVDASSVTQEVFGALFPWLGTVMNREHIRQLSIIVEEVANDTAKALSLISVELKAIRTVTLQNRLALDSLLASRGGTCAVIGETCCSYIPDNSSDIENLASHIRQKVRDLQGITADWSLWSWAQDHLGGWGATIIQSIISIVVVIVAIYLTVACMKVFCTQCMKTTSQPITTQVQRPVNAVSLPEGCFICQSCQEALDLMAYREELLDLDEAILTLMETDPYWDIQYPGA